MPKILQRYPTWCSVELTDDELNTLSLIDVRKFIENEAQANVICAVFHYLADGTTAVRYALSPKPLPFELKSIGHETDDDREIVRYFGENSFAPFPDQVR